MRLIDADALVEFLLKEIIECYRDYDDESDHIILGAGQEAELIRNKVKKMPTVDIVRCKDCKYCDRHHLVDGLFCYRLYEKYNKEYPQMIIEVDADDFCSKGERK